MSVFITSCIVFVSSIITMSACMSACIHICFIVCKESDTDRTSPLLTAQMPTG